MLAISKIGITIWIQKGLLWRQGPERTYTTLNWMRHQFMETIPYGAGGTIDGFRHWRCIASRIESISIRALLALERQLTYPPSSLDGLVVQSFTSTLCSSSGIRSRHVHYPAPRPSMWMVLLVGQTYLSQVSKVPERKYGGQEGNLQSGTVV